MKLSHFALAGLFLLIAAGVYLTVKTDMDGRMDELKAENELKFERYERAQKEQTAMLAKATEALEKQKAAPVPAAATAPKTVASKPPVEPATPVTPGTVAAKKPEIPDPDDVAVVAPKVRPSAVRPDEVDGGGLDNELKNTEELRKKEDEIRKRIAAGEDPADGGVSGSNVTTAPAARAPKLTRAQSAVMDAPAIARVKQVKEADGFVVLDRGQNANLAKGDRFSVRRGTFILGPITISDTIEQNQCVADVGTLIPGAVIQEGDEIVMWK